MKRWNWKKSIAAVLFLCILCAAWYAADGYHAQEPAAVAMQTDDQVSVIQEGNTVAFIPEQADTGLIFYPGGKVEHTAYAPLMRGLAENGVMCLLVEMPLKLAVLDIHAAGRLPQQYPQIERWFVGGHSLGGSMAATHAAENASSYSGVVLLASYSTADLRSSGLPVISIFGSEDGVLNMKKYEENKTNLPSSYEEHILEGGCHAGFGSYGAQDGDGIPTISGDEQVEETVRLLTEFFSAK